VHLPTWIHRSPRLAVAAGVAALAVAAGVAYAAGPAITTSTPRSADDVTNLDVLRQQIRNYYGDPLGTGVFAADSNYATEAEGVAAKGEKFLSQNKNMRVPNRAIVLDVDDTSLATWNYEIFSNWAFNPTTNGQFVTNQAFPAVPGMVEMATEAKAEGYNIFFITGRGATQEAATLGNLTSDGIGVDAGYPNPSPAGAEDGLFTKPAVADYPDYLKQACAGDPNGACTTIHYKSATRAHLESLGFHIVANFGDQFSDLEGGHADATFKMPNPNYFLP
jgi:hypothetical protein